MILALAIAILSSGNFLPTTEYVSDMPDRLIEVEQGWGELGFDVCAHASDQTPLPLQIGSKRYRKGLGNHAPGNLVIDLEGRYLTFDAEVGVQKQASQEGSVAFSVYVDGKKRFDSGVMRQSNAPMPVHINVADAEELRLVAGDAGDGIICDCADWADARLTRSANSPASRQALFDVAPFGQVSTWDPARMDGARASRIEEFHADDVFLDQPVPPLGSGGYQLPSNGCIGLLWLERRRPTVLSLELKTGSATPDIADITAEAWAGMYPFQGKWIPLVGAKSHTGNTIQLNIDPKANPEFGSGFRKVRWVIHKHPRSPIIVAKLGAAFATRMKTATLKLEAEPKAKGVATVELANCISAGHASQVWNMRTAKAITVQYPVGNRSTEASAQPALRIGTPHSSFAVELRDVISGRGVFLKDAGVYIAKASTQNTLHDYKLSIQNQKTILQRVREMPDQTLEQAMQRTYRGVHFGSPTLLSLAEDNWKWLVNPDGKTIWEPGPEVAERQLPFETRRYEVGITFKGANLHPTKTPTLPAGMKRWMPVVALEGGNASSSCRSTSYVAPIGSGKSLLIDRIDLAGEGNCDLNIGFLADRNRNKAASLELVGSHVLATAGDRLMAIVDISQLVDYQIEVRDGFLQVTGRGHGYLVVAVPGWDATRSDPNLKSINDARLATDFISYWNEKLDGGMQINIPDTLLSDIIKTSQVRCLVDARNQENGKRIAPWIAEIHYGPLESEANTIIRGMGLMGHTDFTQKCLDYFINLYSPAGFLTTGYTLVGTGWHLWTLGESFAMTRDMAWMKRHADEVARVCRWVVAERHKTMKLDPLGKTPPQYGLVTPGVIADWNAYQYYFYTNGTYCAGLEAATQALKAVGHPEADGFIAEAKAFRAQIVRAYRWAQARTPAVELSDGTWVPGQPSQVHCPGPLSGYFAGEDGSRSWCYDVELGSHNLVQQGILPPDGEDSKQMADYLEDVMYLKDGWGDYPAEQTQKDWFNLGGFAKVQPYYSRLTEIYAMRDDVKPFIRSYFNMLSALIDPSNLTIWEHFDHLGAPDKTHETGVFLQQTRFMYVKERGQELWLAPFVPCDWLQNDKVVAVKHAPTLFGEVGFRIESHVAKGYVDAVIDPPTRTSPSAIVIRLRHPNGRRMKSVTVNGKPWPRFDPVRETVTVPAGQDPIRVRANY